jgi:D-tagatose-1,6-bisphosphate aldolase subunit GatZ/KbaZ
MKDILNDLRSDHLAGRRRGMVSICSTRGEVLQAAMELAKSRGDSILIETTANQVNQFGGYTGMTPAAFAAHMDHLAFTLDYPRARIFLGADHLGPYTWRNEPAERAMQNALDLVVQCVGAGFRKIHLDTGFGCGDDPQPELPFQIAADRAVVLCRAAESASDRLPRSYPRPLYVIGAEVPPPGGALEDPAALEVTPADRLKEVLSVYQTRFKSARLESAWERVMAVVVQPGVEFGDWMVARYNSQKARDLSLFHRRLPGVMTYEVHSTDYQPADSLTEMVADHFILLKVGPCLTDAFREAVFGLARIESERLARRRAMRPSNIRTVLENVMLQKPVYWQSHYHGSHEQIRVLRSHSKRDRIRYYWNHPDVASALNQLVSNLNPRLVSDEVAAHLPDAYATLAADPCPLEPVALIRRRIQLAVSPYFEACT